MKALSEYKSLKYNPDWRPVERITCECGKVLQAGHAASARHRQSLFHRQHRRIKSLLDANCIPLAEIARRTGVTTQRIQQIASKELHVAGRARRKVCTLERRPAPIASEFVQRVLNECAQRGIQAEPIPTLSGSFQTTAILINGQRVGVSRRNLNTHGYFNISARLDCVFWIGLVESEGAWLIIPRNKMPEGSTTISLYEPMDTRGRAFGKRHDWRDYVDAWHLLQRPE